MIRASSLKSDTGRKIAYIEYDLNNNPVRIQFTNGNVTKYVYSATGEKLRVIYQTSVYPEDADIVKIGKTKELTPEEINCTETVDYLLGGSLVMKNGKIDKVLFDGGYAQASVATKTTDKFAFNFYNQDHLGNNREMVDAKGVVQQVTNYYPFGAPYADATASKGAAIQPYKYNGKELDLMHGLNTYDYGARQHDPILARWDRIDPLCEKYYSTSPYAYCANNPVKFIDPDGKQWKDGDGNVIEDTKNIKVFIFYNSCFEEQAKVQYDAAIETYGENSVAMSLASSTSEFSADWKNMAGTDIANVMIMTHGKNQSIAMDDGSQFTSTGDGKTNIKSSKAPNVQDLPTPKGNISNATLNMYSCHSADKIETEHGTGDHKQGALKGAHKDPIAFAFARKFNFHYVQGTSESVNYHSFFTDGTPSWNENYLRPYPANKGKWTRIFRK